MSPLSDQVLEILRGRSAQDIVERDPYTAAGVARYERLSFNGAFRAPGL